MIDNAEPSQSNTAVPSNVPEPTLQAFAAQSADSLFGTSDPPLVRLKTLLAHSAWMTCTHLAEPDLLAMIAPAVDEAVLKYPDFAMYIEAMSVALLGLLPYSSRISAGEYIESLYCVARYATFLQAARWRSLATESTKGYSN